MNGLSSETHESHEPESRSENLHPGLAHESSRCMRCLICKTHESPEPDHWGENHGEDLDQGRRRKCSRCGESLVCEMRESHELGHQGKKRGEGLGQGHPRKGSRCVACMSRGMHESPERGCGHLRKQFGRVACLGCLPLQGQKGVDQVVPLVRPAAMALPEPLPILLRLHPRVLLPSCSAVCRSSLVALSRDIDLYSGQVNVQFVMENNDGVKGRAYGRRPDPRHMIWGSMVAYSGGTPGMPPGVCADLHLKLLYLASCLLSSRVKLWRNSIIAGGGSKGVPLPAWGLLCSERPLGNGEALELRE